MTDSVSPSHAPSVLHVSDSARDRAELARIFDHSNWDLVQAASVRQARPALLRATAPVLISDRQVADGDWRELLNLVQGLPERPAFILSADAADTPLWAEALNLGAYDVLAKPFDAREVFTVVQMAWSAWRRERDRSRRFVAAISSGSPLSVRT